MKKGIVALLAAALTALVSIAACAAVNNTNDIGFTDVPPDADYAQAVLWCREQGLMNGTSATRFSPNAPLTRSMVVTVLYRAEKEPRVEWKDIFSDVAAGQWYSDAIAWASANEIVGGYGSGLFGADDPITREQLDVIIRRYRGETPAWTGDPALNVPATRAEAAAAFYNTLTAAETPAETDGNVLVAYFSRYGNTGYGENVDAATSASIVVEDGELQGTTERMARIIAEQTGGDLHLIETAENYPADFQEVVERNHGELAAGARPALVETVDFSQYDVVFVGYPVWASNAPTPVLSFLESGNLTGKTVIPFCTHDGYGAGRSYSAVEGSASGATVETGLAVEAAAHNTQETVENWLKDLGFNRRTPEQAAGEAHLRITVEGRELEGILYDSSMARQFLEQLPLTVSMRNYGGREVYGGIPKRIKTAGEGRLRFEDGDITYCPSNNTLAIFYAQTSRPNLTMEVYPIGRVTSDLGLFPALPSRVDITFETK